MHPSLRHVWSRDLFAPLNPRPSHGFASILVSSFEPNRKKKTKRNKRERHDRHRVSCFTFRVDRICTPPPPHTSHVLPRTAAHPRTRGTHPHDTQETQEVRIRNHRASAGVVDGSCKCCTHVVWKRVHAYETKRTSTWIHVDPRKEWRKQTYDRLLQTWKKS